MALRTDLGPPSAAELASLVDEKRPIDAMIRFATLLPESERTRTFLYKVDEALEAFRQYETRSLTPTESRRLVLERLESTKAKGNAEKEPKRDLKELREIIEATPHLSWLKEQEPEVAEARKLQVAFLGVFSSGKSSLINALLGEDDESFLPVGNLPVTSALIELRHGPMKAVTRVDINGQEEPFSLKDFRSLADQTEADSALLADHGELASTTDRFVITHPSSLLESLTIFDTPGFNSGYEMHELVTEEVVSQADVVFWVFNATKAGSATDASEIPHIEAAVGKTVGILNRIDQIRPRFAKKPERWKEELDGVLEDASTNFGGLISDWIPTSAIWMRESHEKSGRDALLATVEAIRADQALLKEEATRKRASHYEDLTNTAVSMWHEARKEQERLDREGVASIKASFAAFEKVVATEGKLEAQGSTYTHVKTPWRSEALLNVLSDIAPNPENNATAIDHMLRKVDALSEILHSNVGDFWRQQILYSLLSSESTRSNSSSSFCGKPSMGDEVQILLYAAIEKPRAFKIKRGINLRLGYLHDRSDEVKTMVLRHMQESLPDSGTLTSGIETASLLSASAHTESYRVRKALESLQESAVGIVADRLRTALAPLQVRAQRRQQASNLGWGIPIALVLLLSLLAHNLSGFDQRIADLSVPLAWLGFALTMLRFAVYPSLVQSVTGLNRQDLRRVSPITFSVPKLIATLEKELSQERIDVAQFPSELVTALPNAPKWLRRGLLRGLGFNNVGEKQVCAIDDLAHTFERLTGGSHWLKDLNEEWGIGTLWEIRGLTFGKALDMLNREEKWTQVEAAFIEAWWMRAQTIVTLLTRESPRRKDELEISKPKKGSIVAGRAFIENLDRKTGRSEEAYLEELRGQMWLLGNILNN